MLSPFSFTAGRLRSDLLLGLPAGAMPRGSSDLYVEFTEAGITALMIVAPWSAMIVPGGGAATLEDGAAAIVVPSATAAIVAARSRRRAARP